MKSKMVAKQEHLKKSKTESYEILFCLILKFDFHIFQWSVK